MPTSHTGGDVTVAHDASWLELLGPELAARRATVIGWKLAGTAVQLAVLIVNMILHVISGPSRTTVLLWLGFVAIAVLQMVVVNPAMRELRLRVALYLGLPPISAPPLGLRQREAFITSVRPGALRGSTAR